jgi:hypothetical protein
LLDRTIFSLVRRREKQQTTIQITVVPARYHNEKDQEARLITPVATPNGIPIINPKPIRKDGAIAISGLLAREKRTIKRSNPKNIRGFIRKPVTSNGAVRTKLPVAGLIAIKFTANGTISVETTEMANPGRKIVRLLPIKISLGLSGVAKRDAMFPLTFSLIIGKLAKAQIKVIRINSGKK